VQQQRLAQQAQQQRVERAMARKREQLTYKVAAIAASTGVGSLAIVATYLRFSRHMNPSGDLPVAEMACTLALIFGGAVSRRRIDAGSLAEPRSAPVDACGSQPAWAPRRAQPISSGIAQRPQVPGLLRP
jgi:hypothetical protein